MSYGKIKRGAMGGDRFTQVSNDLFRNPNLSLKAKGLFGLISTHRDGYGISVASICAQAKEGKEAVKAGLRELEEHGYLYREQQVDTKGRFGNTVYFITDQPEGKNPSSEPLAENQPTVASSEVSHDEPWAGNPLTDNPPAENCGGKKTTSEGDHFFPSGEEGEEHSPASPESALPRDECELRPVSEAAAELLALFAEEKSGSSGDGGEAVALPGGGAVVEGEVLGWSSAWAAENDPDAPWNA